MMQKEVTYQGKWFKVEVVPFEFKGKGKGTTNVDVESMFPRPGRNKYWNWERYPATQDWDALKKEILAIVPTDRIYIVVMDGDPFGKVTAKGRASRVCLFNAQEGVAQQMTPSHWIGVPNNGRGARTNWIGEQVVHYAPGKVF